MFYSYIKKERKKQDNRIKKLYIEISNTASFAYYPHT